MNTLALLLRLLPVILQTVVSVEQAFPAAPGPEKKQAALKQVQDAHTEQLTLEATAAVATAIDQTVAGLNSVGALGVKP